MGGAKTARLKLFRPRCVPFQAVATAISQAMGQV